MLRLQEPTQRNPASPAQRLKSVARHENGGQMLSSVMCKSRSSMEILREILTVPSGSSRVARHESGGQIISSVMDKPRSSMEILREILIANSALGHKGGSHGSFHALQGGLGQAVATSSAEGALEKLGALGRDDDA